MDIKQITENPDLHFASLEDELFRVYEYKGGDRITLMKPVALAVSTSGGHRVLTQDGIAHYIPPGWIHLWWKVREGALPFSF